MSEPDRFWKNFPWIVLAMLFVMGQVYFVMEYLLGEETAMGFIEWVRGATAGAKTMHPYLEKLALIFIYPGAAATQWLSDWPSLRIPAMVAVAFWFWNSIPVRILKLIGLYNPFWRVRSGLWLRPVVRAIEAVEHLAFGAGPTARWAWLLEVVARPWYPDSIFLGRPRVLTGGMLRPVGIKTERHMITIAGTGAGKSTGAIIPNLCLHQGSLLCIDPKGELAEITRWRRGAGGNGVQGMGQEVHVVDPYDTVGGAGRYNPFAEMAAVVRKNPNRAVSFADKIAESVVKPMGGTSSDYWDKAARTLIRGVVLYIFVQEPPHNRNLVRLRELLMEGDAQTYRQAVAAGQIERRKVSPFELLLEQMIEARDGDYGYAIAGAASSVIEMCDGQYGSVLTTAQEHTAFLDFPEVRAVAQGSDFELGDLKRKPMSVYVVLPASAAKGTQGRWLRMFMILFMDIMQHDMLKPDPPVLLAIDEFPNLGRIDGIEAVAPLMRSYGVRFWAATQDIHQLMNLYEDCWSGFLGNAEAVQFMSITEMQTVKMVFSILGSHVIKTKEYSYTAPLLDAEQIGRFLSPESENQIIWFGRHHPMRLKVTPYYKYLPFWYYDPDPRYKEKPNRRFWRWLARLVQPARPPAGPRPNPPPVRKSLAPPPARLPAPATGGATPVAAQDASPPPSAPPKAAPASKEEQGSEVMARFEALMRNRADSSPKSEPAKEEPELELTFRPEDYQPGGKYYLSKREPPKKKPGPEG